MPEFLREKMAINENFEKNKWKKKLSKLFTSAKDLNESIKVGDDHIGSFMADFKL